MGENLSALEFARDFLARTQKNEPLKNKINKLDYIEICICFSKASAKKIKGWPLARKKILFADISNKGLVPKYTQSSFNSVVISDNERKHERELN